MRSILDQLDSDASYSVLWLQIGGKSTNQIDRTPRFTFMAGTVVTCTSSLRKECVNIHPHHSHNTIISCGRFTNTDLVSRTAFKLAIGPEVCIGKARSESPMKDPCHALRFQLLGLMQPLTRIKPLNFGGMFDFWRYPGM